MDQRTRAVRFLALLLALTWATLGGWLVLGLVNADGAGLPATDAAGLVIAAWPFLPAVVAAAAAFAPARPDAAAVPIVALGGMALLLAVSLAVTLAEAASAPERVLVGASPAMAFGGALAVTTGVLFTAFAWRPKSRTATALTLSLVAGAAAGAGLVLPAAGTAAAGCGLPSAAASGRLEVVAEASVNSRPIGRATVSGERSGRDERWRADVGGEIVDRWSAEFVRVGDSARLRRSGDEWQAVSVESPATAAGTLDGRLLSLLAERAGPGVEDRGIEVLHGQPLRHCRLLVSGSQALRAFEPLGWLIGREPLEPEPALEVWRGDLDWWMDAAGELAVARVHLGGLASDAWPGYGPRGLLRADLRVLERNAPRDIDEPLP